MPQPECARPDGRRDEGLLLTPADDAAAGGAYPALFEDSAEDLYEEAPCGYLSAHPDGLIARVNRTFLTWTGFARDDLVGKRRFADLLDAGGRIYHETHYAPLLRMQGTVRAIALTMVKADGSTLPVLVNARMRSDEHGHPLATRITVFDASDRKQYETELLEARRRAEHAVHRLQLVERVVADLAAVAWVEEVTRIVSDAGQDAFGAQASGVWLLDPESGRLVGSATSIGSQPGRPPDIPLSAPVATDPDLRLGQVVVAAAADAETAYPHVSAALGPGARGTLVLVPLSVNDRTTGVLAMRFGDERALDEPERVLLQTLGRQTGQALERAQLTEQQRNVATTLQRSLLPAELPDDPRVTIATMYRPAFASLEVGGDWYDAFRLDKDRMALVVGDVVGRGLHAAAAMGQLRSAIRALAAVGSGPAFVLQRLDAFVDGFQTAQMATLAYAEMDLRDGAVRYACAGHPPPVVLDKDGHGVLLWQGRSTPLGAQFGNGHRPEAHAVLPPGSRMLLYTDGLVERRNQPLDESFDRLVTELTAWADSPLEALTEGIVDVMLQDEDSRDDVCLLAVAYG
ncbi:MAG TPA: SpoIIE family protein phosphatase [Actinomycetes bacterium]|nr:SpoIIE family protein phosphatase [Actinomycetes bacterium]